MRRKKLLRAARSSSAPPDPPRGERARAARSGRALPHAPPARHRRRIRPRHCLRSRTSCQGSARRHGRPGRSRSAPLGWSRDAIRLEEVASQAAHPPLCLCLPEGERGRLSYGSAAVDEEARAGSSEGAILHQLAPPGEGARVGGAGEALQGERRRAPWIHHLLALSAAGDGTHDSSLRAPSEMTTGATSPRVLTHSVLPREHRLPPRLALRPCHPPWEPGCQVREGKRWSERGSQGAEWMRRVGGAARRGEALGVERMCGSRRNPSVCVYI